MTSVDAVVIGSGPNGLAAAAVLAEAGWDVAVVERSDVTGGAIRSEERTVPGFVHDTFSAFYGVLHSSPLFERMGLAERVEWAHFDRPVAAVVEPGRVAVCHLDPAETAAGLGPAADQQAWADLWNWWDARGGRDLYRMVTGPLGPTGPVLDLVRTAGLGGAMAAAPMMLRPVADEARRRFTSEEARVLFASGVTHADVAADRRGSTPAALFLAMVGQEWGMPVPVGGAGWLAAALVEGVTEMGAQVTTGTGDARVELDADGRATTVVTESGDRFTARRAVLADTGPGRLTSQLVGDRHFPRLWRRGVRRFRYGTGMFRLDVALDGPAPWSDGELGDVGVVHLTGDLDAITLASRQANDGALPSCPTMIVGQQSVADPSRAPAGGHTLWIETHVPPHPSSDAGDGAVAVQGRWDANVVDAFTERLLDRVEHHAPGFRQRIRGLSPLPPTALEAANPNLVGGDVAGGATTLDQMTVFRPVFPWFRYATPIEGLYLCSASTHPGGGVHGLCGLHAARRVLADHRP